MMKTKLIEIKEVINELELINLNEKIDNDFVLISKRMELLNKLKKLVEEI